MEVKDAKKKHEKKLLKKANVVGVMTGRKTVSGVIQEVMCVVCLVEKKVDVLALKRKDRVPYTVEGFLTDVVEVGKIKALDLDRKAKHRPCPMGTSGGHYQITAGTNGELLRSKLSGALCIGTNNHVAANSNDAKIGDPYLQPGPYDGGNVNYDVIGRLLRFVPIVFPNSDGNGGGCPLAKFVSWLFNILAGVFKRATRLKSVITSTELNLVDAALVEVNDPTDVLPAIDGIGIPKGVCQATVDMLVQKSGRTTGHTTKGKVIAIDATIDVDYGKGAARFVDQIIIQKDGFCAGGDSGSLVLDMNKNAVGKLFAGNDKDMTIANHIHDYLTLLDAELVIS